MAEQKPQDPKVNRSAAARKEIAEILAKYNCYVDVFVKIGTDNTVRGEFEIKPK